MKHITDLLLPALARLAGLSSALTLVVGNLGARHDSGVEWPSKGMGSRTQGQSCAKTPRHRVADLVWAGPLHGRQQWVRQCRREDV